MIEESALRENYSGIVKLRLRVGDQEYRLSRLGPDYVSFRDAVDLPPCEGEVIMTVDDRQHIWSVALSEGASVDSERVSAIPASGSVSQQ